jgi:poly(3-hydroxybutyrate) depolymerase
MIKPLLLSAIITLLSACQSSVKEKKQFDFRIDTKNMTLSGVSSGAYIATQFHLAHSAKISAVALIAGGPYWCAQGSISKALGACMKGGQIEPVLINEYVETSEKMELIDPTSNLANDKIWVFHGNKDIVMAFSVSQAIERFYNQFLNKDNINMINNIPANHGMPTLSNGGSCDSIQSPFLNSCDYDAAGEILKTFHGPLKARTEAIEELQTLDQSEFKEAQFTDTGYLYVPTDCKNNELCQLHVVFHGCMQSSEFIGDEFVKSAGYNEWAQSNNIVVFYPQIQSSNLSPLNPKGCWDWWGYTDENYANKKGPQIIAINSMIDKISGVKK